MKTLALHEMGEVIRKVRKDRGLRLEDLADQNISPATVSNIERGVAHVSPEKITYLLEKLDLPMSQLPEMLTQEQEELKRIKFKLQSIATLRKIGHIDEALERLEEFDLDESHPYIVHVYYYKGKCYTSKRKWKQAERALFTGLRILSQNSYNDNMEAAIYLILGLLSYYQNDLEQAIIYTNNGITSFSDEGENKHIKYLLYRNKGVYLQRLGRVTEGIRLVQDIWGEVRSIEDVITGLAFYWLRAEFSRVSGLYEEAIDYAVEGIELSRRNQQFDSMCDLWTVLGSVYTAKKEWDLADTSFTMALKLGDSFPKDQRLATVYTRMGVLYMKQKKKEEAYKMLLTAIKYAEEFDDAPRLTTSLIIMGDLCQELNKKEEAIGFYSKALQLAKKHEYKDKELKVWFNLARCYDGKDDKEFNNCMRNMYNAKKFTGHPEVEHNEYRI